MLVLKKPIDPGKTLAVGSQSSYIFTNIYDFRMGRLFFILLFGITQQSIMCYTEQYNLFDSVKAEIARKLKMTISDLLILRSSSENSVMSIRDFTNYAVASSSISNSVDQSTKLLLDHTELLNLTSRFRRYLLTFRYSEACSVVLHENAEIIHRFRGVVLDKVLPGGALRSFHIYSQVNLVNKASMANSELKYMSYINFNETDPLVYPMEGLFDTTLPNWNNKPLQMTITEILISPNKKLFETTGKWDLGCMGYTHYAAKLLNATVRYEPIKVPPSRKSSNVITRFDAYVDPLLSGAMQVTCRIFDPSMIPYGVVFLSKTTEYDKITFATRLPEAVKITSLFQSLTYPFDSTLWGFTGLSIAGVALIIFMVMTVFNKKDSSTSSPLNHLSNAIMAVLRTALDQPGSELDISSYVKRKAHSWLVLLLWSSLSSIVLCNLYKSVLISALIKPDFAFVPKTFKELVESSWAINAMLYKQSLKVLFEEIDDQITRALLQRAKGVQFVDGRGMCFREIMNSNSVCMGHLAAVKLFSAQELTDSQGKGSYRHSDDGIFSSFGAMGISRKYPHVIEAILYVQNAVETTGIARHWRTVGFYQTRMNGKIRSRSQNGTSAADKASTAYKNPFENDKYLVTNLLEVQLIGTVLSAGLFFTEIFVGRCIMRTKTRNF